MYRTKLQKFISWTPIKDDMFKLRMAIQSFTLILAFLASGALFSSIFLLFSWIIGGQETSPNFLTFIPIGIFVVLSSNMFLTSWVMKSTQKEILANKKPYLLASYYTLSIWTIFFIKKVVAKNKIDDKNQLNSKQTTELPTHFLLDIFTRIIPKNDRWFKARFNILFWTRLFYIPFIVGSLFLIVRTSTNIISTGVNITEVILLTIGSLILFLIIPNWIITHLVLKSTTNEILRYKTPYLLISYLTLNVWTILFIKKIINEKRKV